MPRLRLTLCISAGGPGPDPAAEHGQARGAGDHGQSHPGRPLQEGRALRPRQAPRQIQGLRVDNSLFMDV